MRTLPTVQNGAQRTGNAGGQWISSALALLLVTTLLVMALAPFDVAAKKRDQHGEGDAQVQTVQEDSAPVEEAPAPREEAPAPEEDASAPREEGPPAGGGNQGGEQNQDQAQDQNQSNEDSGREREATREEGSGSASDGDAPRDDTPREDGQDEANGGEGTGDDDPGRDGTQQAPTEDAAPGDGATDDQTAPQGDDEAATRERERNRDEETPEPEVTPVPPPVVHVSGDAACSDRGSVEGVAIVRVDDAPATITDMLVVPSPDSPPIVPALRENLPAVVEPGRADWRWSLSPQPDGGTGWFPTTVLVRVAEYAPNGSGDEGWLSADLAPFAQPCAPPAPETAEPASASDGAAAPAATAVTNPAEEPREESGNQTSDAGQAPSLGPGDAVVVTGESELREGSSWSVLLVVPAGSVGEILSGPYQAEDASWWYEVAVPQATGFLVAGTLALAGGDDPSTDDGGDGEVTPSPTATPDAPQEPAADATATPQPSADVTATPEPVDEESSGDLKPDAEAPAATPEPSEGPGVADPADEAVPTPEPTETPFATATPELIATPIAEPTEAIPETDAIAIEAINPDNAVQPGETVQYRFRLTNTSDSSLSVRPVVSNTRDGWTAVLVRTAGSSGDGALTLGAGERVDVVVEVMVPEFAPAGEKNTTTLVLEAAEHVTG